MRDIGRDNQTDSEKDNGAKQEIVVIHVAIVVFLANKLGTLGLDMPGCLALCIVPCVDADQAV